MCLPIEYKINVWFMVGCDLSMINKGYQKTDGHKLCSTLKYLEISWKNNMKGDYSEYAHLSGQSGHSEIDHVSSFAVYYV